MHIRTVITEEIIKNIKDITEKKPEILFDNFFDQENEEIKQVKDFFDKSINIDDKYFDFKGDFEALDLKVLNNHFDAFIEKTFFNINRKGSITPKDSILLKNRCNYMHEALAYKSLNDTKKAWLNLKEKNLKIHKNLKKFLLEYNLKALIGENILIFIDDKNEDKDDTITIVTINDLYFNDYVRTAKEHILISPEKAENCLRAYAFAYSHAPILNPNIKVLHNLAEIIQPYVDYIGTNNLQYHKMFELFNQGHWGEVIAMYNAYVYLVGNTIENLQNQRMPNGHAENTKYLFLETFKGIKKCLQNKDLYIAQNYNKEKKKEILLSNLSFHNNSISKFIQDKIGKTMLFNEIEANNLGAVSSYYNDPISEVYQNYRPLNNIQETCLNYIKKFNISSIFISCRFKITEEYLFNALSKLEQAYMQVASTVGVKREYLGNGINIYLTPNLFYSGMYTLEENSISFNPIYLNFAKTSTISSTILHEWIHHIDFILTQKHSELFDYHSCRETLDCYSNVNVIKGVFFNSNYDITGKKAVNALLAHQHITQNIFNSKNRLKDREQRKRDFVLTNLLHLNRDLMEDPLFEFSIEEKAQIEHERLYNCSLFKLKDSHEFEKHLRISEQSAAAFYSLFDEMISNKEIYFPRIKHDKCHHLSSAFQLMNFFFQDKEANSYMKYFNIYGENTYGDFFAKEVKTSFKDIAHITSSYNNGGSAIVFLSKIQDYIDNKKIIKHFYKSTPGSEYVMKQAIKNNNIFSLHKIIPQQYTFHHGLYYFQSPEEILARYFEDAFFKKEGLKTLYKMKLVYLSPLFINKKQGEEHLDLLLVSIFGEKCLATRGKEQNHQPIEITENGKIIDCGDYTIESDDLLGLNEDSIYDISQSKTPTKDLIERSKNIRQKLEEQSDISPIHTKILNQIKTLLKPKTKTNKFENKETVHVNPISLYESSIPKTKHKDKR